MSIVINPAVCGSLQSNDCLVEVAPADTLIIEVQSPLKDRFGDLMEAAVRTSLQAAGIEKAYVRVTDRGALDCTIRARTKVALERAGRSHS